MYSDEHICPPNVMHHWDERDIYMHDALLFVYDDIVYIRTPVSRKGLNIFQLRRHHVLNVTRGTSMSCFSPIAVVSIFGILQPLLRD